MSQTRALDAADSTSSRTHTSLRGRLGPYLTLQQIVDADAVDRSQMIGLRQFEVLFLVAALLVVVHHLSGDDELEAAVVALAHTC